MKALTYIAAVAASVFMLSSCGILGGSSSLTSAQQTVSSTGSASGQAAGAALKSLYGQYKSSGSLQLTNMTNVVNIATLVQNIQGLKGQSDKSAFYKDFASGLILGSDNLVTEKTSTTVMSGLSSLAESVDASSILNSLSKASSTASSNVSSAVSGASNIADSVTSLLNLFK